MAADRLLFTRGDSGISPTTRQGFRPPPQVGPAAGGRRHHPAPRLGERQDNDSRWCGDYGDCYYCEFRSGPTIPSGCTAVGWGYYCSGSGESDSGLFYDCARDAD